MILGIDHIDHIGLVTDDPAGVGAVMAALGLRMVDDGVAEAYGVACEGARTGMRVAFMYVRKPAGLLIELVQYSPSQI